MPSALASVPFAPEYFGKSYLPPSIWKWRCPRCALLRLPTSPGSRLKFFRQTSNVTVEPVAAFAFGVTNVTAGLFEAPVAAGIATAAASVRTASAFFISGSFRDGGISKTIYYVFRMTAIGTFVDFEPVGDPGSQLDAVGDPGLRSTLLFVRSQPSP